MFTLFADGDLWTNFKWCMFVFFAIVGLIGWAIGQTGGTRPPPLASSTAAASCGRPCVSNHHLRP